MTTNAHQPGPRAQFSKRLVAVLATMGVLATMLPGAVPVLSPTPASAGPADNFTLSKTDDVGGEALIGEQITFTLTATGSQSSNAFLYNLSFRDVLPVGVDFVSADPAPTAILDDVPTVGRTTIIWENVSDLPADSQSSVSLTVDTNPDFVGGTTGALTVPVGSSFTNNAEAAASLDAFTIPNWSPATGAFTGDFDGNATASRVVDVIPFRVTKTGPGELLRGVHANGFDGASGTTGGLYTVQIENNPDYPVNAVTLRDTLHPGLEFLGCDDYYAADNTTVGEEWIGSGPVATGAGCAPTPLEVPTSVATALGGDTIVDWTIGNLTPGQIVNVRYQAGIPRFENRPFAASPPAANSRNQGRNLDNNTGPSTGEPDRTTNADPELLDAPEPGIDNVAVATGTYTPAGSSVTADDTHVTEAEDLVITKSSTGSLSQGTIVTTTLTITTSEYRDFADLVVRDLMPSALCFLGTYNADATPSSGWNTTDCPGQGTVRSTINGTPVDVARVRELPTGGPYGTGRFELVWDFSDLDNAALADLDADGTLTITYASVVRQSYRGGLAQLAGEPVLAGDTVTNEVEVSGPDSVADASLAPDPADPDPTTPGTGIDGDTASAGLDNLLPTIDKRIGVKTGPLANGSSVTPGTCAASHGAITWSDGSPAELGFGPGDIVCFELGASFPSNVDYEGVTIQDLLPPGYRYLAGSAARVTSVDTLATTSVASSSVSQVTFDVSGGNVEANGNEFRWTIAAELTDNAEGQAFDINANLQKMIHNNNGGLVFQLRDEASAEWTEPEVRLVKGVRDVNNGAVNGPDFDGSRLGGSTSQLVRIGDEVTFRVDVWNQGNTNATATEVRDVLPTDFTCSDVDNISNGGTCSAGIVGWTGLTVPQATAMGTGLTLTYDLTIPATITAGDNWTNTAGVAFYQGATNRTGTYDYYPANNINPAFVANQNTDRADDRAFLDSPDPVLVKAQATGITEGGNAAANRATIGEIIRYQVTATVPAGTAIYGGQISDVLPAGLVWHTGPGLFGGTVSNLTPGATSATGSAALAGSTVINSGQNVTYVFPTPYTNATGSGDDQVTITFYARVTNVGANDASPSPTLLRNTARFNWNDSAGNPSPQLSSNNADTYVVEPNPQIDKIHTSPTGPNAGPGDTVTYQVTVSNPTAGVTNVSRAHDLRVVDSVPVGLTPLGTGGIPVTANGDLVPSTGVSPVGAFNGTWSQSTRQITWNPTDWVAGLDGIDPGASSVFTYGVRVDDPAVASSSRTNSASLRGYTLDQNLSPTPNPGQANARLYNDVDTDTIAVPPASITKDIEPFNPGNPADDLATATVGAPVDYRVTMTLPDDTIAYDTTLFDELPGRLDFDSFGAMTISPSCEVLNGATGLTTGSSLAAVDVEQFHPTGGVNGRLAWFLGDLFANGDCTISVDYTAHVNTTAFATDSITNDAKLVWNGSNQVVQNPAPLPAGYDDPDSPSWTVGSGVDSETFSVVEPSVRIDKDVADVGGSALVDPACDVTPGNILDADGTAANGCDTRPGAALRYLVTLTAGGTSPSHDITVVDAVPVGLNPLAAPGGAPVTTNGDTVTGNSGSVGTWSETNRTITWSVVGPLAPAAVAAFDYDVELDASDDLTRGQDLANMVTVPSFFAFPAAERAQIVLDNPANDDIVTYGSGPGATRGMVAPDVVTVEVHFPTLSVDKAPGIGQDVDDVRLDQPFTWTITITNTDAVAPAHNVDVSDVLPEGWTYDPASATVTTPYGTAPVEPVCSADTGLCNDPASLNVETLQWADLVAGPAQPLGPGQTIVITMTATPRSAALVSSPAIGIAHTGPTNPHTNSVSVIGEDATGSTSCCDPDGPGGTPAPTYSDTDTDDVFIARADLEVDKTISPVELDADAANGPYWFGSYVNYTVVVDNVGPDPATTVSISDVLDPSELAFDSVVLATQGSFDSGTNVWTIGTIPDGGQVTLTLRTRLVALGPVTNIAQAATADQYDADSIPGNDTPSEDDQDSVTIEVVPTSLGDFIWLDLDADGIQDPSEPGIPGVAVDITWDDPATGAPQSYSTVTAGDGSYGVPLAVGLPADTDVTVTVDTASPNLSGLTQSYDRDGTVDDATTEQITTGDTVLPSGPIADLAFDFGYTPDGTQQLGDKVWWDADNSGGATNGAGEPGIPGVDITATWAGWDDVLGNGDDIDFLTTTDAAGNYLFPNVPVGDYRITLDSGDLPNGLDLATFDLDGTGTAHVVDVVLDPAEAQLDIDFSYTGTGSLGDTVWFDDDADGTIDPGEPGLGGATVRATWDGPNGIAGDADDVVLTTVTAFDGTYGFANLPHGRFTVTVDTATIPGGLAPTFDADGIGTANSSVVDLTAVDNVDLDQDFGYRGLGSIGDTVFFDIDGTETDGIPDAGDAGLPGVDLTIVWAGANGTLGDGDDFTFTDTTDGSGNYLVTGLPHGNYSVTADASDLPPGLTSPTHDDDGVGTPHVSLVALDAITPDRLDQDFAYTGETDGRIGDTVWFDHDGDGVQSGPIEVGFSGVTVTLVWFGGDGLPGGGDDVTQTTTTDAAGNYLFDNLPDGEFTVTVDPLTIPAGLVQTFDADGAVTTPNTSAVTLASGSRTQLDQDFGYRGLGSLGDLVWFDIDGSAGAAPDPGEPGIGGVDVTVTWTNPQGSDVTITTTTAPDGSYVVTHLPYGDHVVSVVATGLPSGLTASFDADGIISADTSSVTLDGVTPDRLDQDFSYTGVGSIGDTVWFDQDADGTTDPVGSGVFAGQDQALAGIDLVVTFGGFDGVIGDDLGTIPDESADDVAYAATSDGNGEWVVGNLAFGPYRVDVVASTLPAGLDVATFDADGVTSVHVSNTTLDALNPDRLDQDFSYTGAGSIGDVVWFDRDGDGAVGADEVALGDVDVTLTYTGPDGSVITVVDTTDADGVYAFDDLPFDTVFTITVDATDLPSGFVPTHDADGIGTPHVSTTTLTAGAPIDLDQDFGYHGAGSLGDTVWLDRDVSGTDAIDPGDFGLPDVDLTIVWTNPTSGPDMTVTVTTDADGFYRLDGLPHGDYTVTLVPSTLPGGVVPTFDADGIGTANTSSVTLDALVPDDLDQDFSVAGTGSLGDTVWRDDDGDGVIDAGEPRLGGVEITLVWTDPVTGATFTETTTTAGDGTYGFTDLPAGDHTVTVTASTLPSGAGPTHDLDGTDTRHVADLTLGDGEDRPDVDFGYRIEADLAIDKSHVGDFTVGSTNRWTLAITNQGAGTAEAPIVVTDTLPDGTTFVGADGDDWACVSAAPTVTCTLVDPAGTPTSMVAGLRSDIEIRVDVAVTAIPTVINTASVESPTFDPNPGNDTDADPTAVPFSVIDIDKSLSGSLRAGSTATYRLVVTNLGPSATRGTVTVVDDLPNSLSYVSSSSSTAGTSCSVVGDLVTCVNPMPMAVDSTWTIDLVVRVSANATGAVVNNATVSGGNAVNGVPLDPGLVASIYDTLATPGNTLTTQLGLSPSVGATTRDGAVASVSGPSGALAFTGSNTLDLVLWAAIMMGVGGAAVILTNRRRRHFV